MAADGAIRIRRFRPDDVSRFHSAVASSVDTLSRWMPWCHPGYSLDEARAWLATCESAWATGSSYPFLISDAGSDEVLGSVDINQINREHQSGNIGYWVRSSHMGRGVATTAVRLVAHFGFTQASFTRLEIVALPDNTASRRVAEKAGARFECIARNRLVGWGRAHDAAVYSLIPTDLTA